MTLYINWISNSMGIQIQQRTCPYLFVSKRNFCVICKITKTTSNNLQHSTSCGPLINLWWIDFEKYLMRKRHFLFLLLSVTILMSYVLNGWQESTKLKRVIYSYSKKLSVLMILNYALMFNCSTHMHVMFEF